MKSIVIAALVLLLAACESNPPAPVIERVPQSGKPKPPNNQTNSSQSSKIATNKDWRPDSHIVKKGDTLFSIGLEYGYDYKEIAAANNISAPYPIQIGQKLALSSLNNKMNVAETGKATPTQTEDGVVLTPMKTDPVVTGDKTATESKPIISAVTPILSEPKAVREAYSLEAMNRTVAINNVPVKNTPTKAAEIKPAETKPIDTKPTDTKPTDDEAIAWIWPAQGKVVASFNEATNKGLDIGGSTGQAINAASSGKVIYSGSDLRGYGKLVIIKHNKTFLSVYAHNSKILVKEGQLVASGQKIAEMGNTDSNTVKLHFEIRRLGKSVDPAKYLSPN